MLKDLLRTEYPEMEFTDNVNRWIEELETGNMSREHMVFHICTLLMQINQRERQLDAIVTADWVECYSRDELEWITEEMWAVNI
jgi:hypothetical protein